MGASTPTPQQVAAEFPPLTEEQVATIAALLSAATQHTQTGKAASR